jgi:hypothetical protein
MAQDVIHSSFESKFGNISENEDDWGASDGGPIEGMSETVLNFGYRDPIADVRLSVLCECASVHSLQRLGDE